MRRNDSLCTMNYPICDNCCTVTIVTIKLLHYHPKCELHARTQCHRHTHTSALHVSCIQSVPEIN